MNIYEKIHAVMKSVEYLSKDDKVEFGNTKYKAISEEKVTSTIRAKLVEQKLVIFPVNQEHKREGTLSTVDVTYRIVNCENPDEFIEVVSSGTGADTQDKGVGKAMTYAYKYMLLRTFAIPTGEDPDKISSEQIDAEEQERKKQEQKSSAQFIDKTKVKALTARCKTDGVPVERILTLYKVPSFEYLTEKKHENINIHWEEIKRSA